MGDYLLALFLAPSVSQWADAGARLAVVVFAVVSLGLFAVAVRRAYLRGRYGPDAGRGADSDRLRESVRDAVRLARADRNAGRYAEPDRFALAVAQLDAYRARAVTDCGGNGCVALCGGPDTPGCRLGSARPAAADVSGGRRGGVV